MTGGMGAYSPNYVYTEEIAKQVETEILQPINRHTKREDGLQRHYLCRTYDYKEGPKVLEYNVRLEILRLKRYCPG